MIKVLVVESVVSRVGLAALLALSVLATPVRAASAAGLTVTTTTDELNADGDCSLREAIRAANTNLPVDRCPAGGSGTDTITLPAGTFDLTRHGTGEDAAATGDLDLTSHVKIVGAGTSSTYIHGQVSDRIFDIFTGINVSLNKLVVLNGAAPDGGGVRNAGSLVLNQVYVQHSQAGVSCTPTDCEPTGGGRGGGIYNTGSLTLTGRSMVSSNAINPTTGAATSGARSGGGIYNAGTLVMNDSLLSYNVIRNTPGSAETSGAGLYNAGNAQISRSAIYNNSATNCCGAAIYNAATLKMTNVTVSQNYGGGHGGGLYNRSTAVLNNVTISANRIDNPELCTSTCLGGGVHNASSGSLYLTNVLIANNEGTGPDCAGVVISQRHNLIEQTNRCTVTGDPTGNIYGQDPLLSNLQTVGGLGPYYYLRAGSPAIDAANSAAPGSGGNACPKLDQIGTTRPRDGNGDGLARCDIGAIERR